MAWCLIKHMENLPVLTCSLHGDFDLEQESYFKTDFYELL